MKFLIAGLGSIGRRHFRNLRALGENDILLYRTHRATLPDDELAGFPVEKDLQAALAHKPDAVVVSNPTALHLDVAIPAAEAGCHLLLEKPISHSMERVENLREAVARTGALVLVGFQFRFHPGLQMVKDLLARGEIGMPVSVHAHWGEYLPNWHPWEDFRTGYAARLDLGGGVVLTLCHPLDYLRMLLGDAEGAWSLTSNQGLGLSVEDTAEIGLQFANGAVGSVHLDYVQRPPKHWLEIVGTEGTLHWDNADGAVNVFRASQNAWETHSTPVGFERNEMFLDQMRHFLAVIRGEEEPVCSLEDGIAALELAISARDFERKVI
jgi:predicted dehydrogenase